MHHAKKKIKALEQGDMVWRLNFFASALGLLCAYLEVKIVNFVKRLAGLAFHRTAVERGKYMVDK
ncbi:hypothetical protein AVENLUH13518_01300 [Acinetobacter venetianus]|uniref:Uncharacterized protein n=1 Tax=Acinetobacter venetianus TaxID=52133 RepID=A0A150HX28_9GAMM|nr:hypothetical protein AVENLUH13518_01300 [Acinetobacter venetianus]